MMLEDQVCSLELSKKLKDIGFKHDSYYVWITVLKTGFNFIKRREDYEPDSIDVGAFNYPAFSGTELGEILRDFDINNDLHLTIDSYNTYDYYNLVLKPTKGIDFHELYIKDFKECDVRARMLIFILENNLMEFPE